MTFPRVVTFIDEKVNEIEPYDLVLSQVAKVVEHVQDDDHAPCELRDGLAVLQSRCPSHPSAPLAPPPPDLRRLQSG
jgi:hypothetical protein